MARQAHLVGSVGLENAETVFTTVSEIIGDCCPRIPDGETGARGYWIRWQEATFDGCDDLEVELVDQKLPGFKDTVRRSFYRIKDGVNPDNIDLGDLGYGREAVESYALFSKLQSDGKVPAGARFQVSVPTPMALLCGFVMAADQLKLEFAIEAAMARDLAMIQAEIPADKLSIQFDVCYEVVGTDGGLPLPYDDPIAGSVARVARLCGLIGANVDLGIHLCYGDPGHQHIIQPANLGTSVAFANGIVDQSPRTVNFVHMPVPRGRSDDDYFKPLEGLRLPATTRLILGLVHHTDGIDGSRARMAAADKVVGDYDIATECGFGRRDPGTIRELLKIHRDLCS